MAERVDKDHWPDFLHKLKELQHRVRGLESKKPAEYELFLVDLSEWRLRLSMHTPLIWVKAAIASRLPVTELAASLRDIANERGWRHQDCLVLLDGDGRELKTEMIGWDVSCFVIIDHTEQRRILAAHSPTFAMQDVVCEQIPISNLAPYEVGASVEGNRFFGRAAEIRQIIGRPDSSFAITGVRRIGKTSLMKEIRRRLLDQGESLERIAWLDCSTLSSLNQFEQEIVRQLYARELPSMGRQYHFSLTDFLSRMYKMHGGRITIFLDEVDKILDWARDNLSTVFRASANTSDCRYVLAGFQKLMSETYNSASPLYQIVRTVRLRPFERRDTEDIVLKPMRSLRVRFENEQELVTRIQADTRGHPLFVQFYCEKLIEQLEEQATRRLSPKNVDGIYESKDFKDLVLNSFDENVSDEDKLLVYAMLLSFPESKETFQEEEMCDALSRHGVATPPDQIRRACSRLEMAGVLVKEGLRYEFAIPVFPRTLRTDRNLGYWFTGTSKEIQR